MQMWIANSFVIGATTVLFLLWFRYMCSLLLAAQTSLDSSEAVARANSLAFAEVLRELNGEEAVAEDRLAALTVALDRDFEVVTYLLRHMGESPIVDSPTEAWMLKVDYKLQRFWFQHLLTVSPAMARHQVSQMALIICHFADLIGERRVPARI